MQNVDFIQDLAVVLLIAGIAAAICRKARLSSIVGYLGAGILIGPYTPPFAFVTDMERIHTLSQVGLIFLMFGIGLGLSLSRLRSMGAQMVFATGLCAFFVLNLALLLGQVVGWSTVQSVFVAALLMVSSSAVISKVMQELNLSHTRPGQIALSMTVLEDIVAVVMLAILGAQSGLAATEGVGALLTGLSAFVVLLVMLGLFFVPRVLRRFDSRADPEIQTLLVAGGMFLLALVAVKAGYSLALGAFTLGAIVAETPQARMVERNFSGARDMFSSVFFVSIGMLIDFRLLIDAWPWVLGLTAFAVVARPVAAAVGLTLVGIPSRDARLAGLALMPLGEFSFLVAQLGIGALILPPEFYPIAVGTSLLTVFLMPLINRHGPALLNRMERLEPEWSRRAHEGYTAWVDHLVQLGAAQLWWRLSKKRFAQIGLEMLFITGLLIFSNQLLDALEGTRLAERFDEGSLRLAFWTVIGIAVLIPLVSIWRNISALSLIFGEIAGSGKRVSAGVAVTAVRVVGAVGLSYWLVGVFPIDDVTHWSWLIVVVILVIALAVSHRRLVYWHSEWQHALEQSFASSSVPLDQVRRWMGESSRWSLHVQEHTVSDRALCVGRSIGELGLRSRHGCTIAEINRQGYLIVAPSPDDRLFPGDQLLILGEDSAIKRAREELDRTRDDGAADLQEAILETVEVVEGPRIGRTLAELQIPLHTDVLVFGIDRMDRRMTNPSGSETIEMGDRLLVLGTPKRLRRFRDWLKGEDSGRGNS